MMMQLPRACHQQKTFIFLSIKSSNSRQTNMSAVLTHKTALCLIPPENVWEQIQSIRSVHDKAYARWMPHINLIYPFAPESDFGNIKMQLESMVNKKAPFEIEFDQTSFHYFKQKGSECTFHLRPKISKNLIELQQIIQKSLPSYATDSRPFEPHLTLGQTTSSRISDILIEMKAKWKPIKFSIDRVCLISRENDRNDLFSIKDQVNLGDQQEDEVQSLPIEIPIEKEIPTNLSTTNCLCIIPPNEFSTRLLRLFEDTSFRPLKPFRIILVEYEDNFNEADLCLKLESIRKFTLDFGARSICFNYSTSRIFLKPSDLESIQRLNLNNDKQFDGTLTLGQLDKNDLTEVGNRFTQSWTMGTNEFEVDRLHLIDSNGRFQCTVPLKSQSFS
jgi:2'-5' RNA ligase